MLNTDSNDGRDTASCVSHSVASLRWSLKALRVRPFAESESLQSRPSPSPSRPSVCGCRRAEAGGVPPRPPDWRPGRRRQRPPPRALRPRNHAPSRWAAGLAPEHCREQLWHTRTECEDVLRIAHIQVAHCATRTGRGTLTRAA